jgi:hypothetical protein
MTVGELGLGLLGRAAGLAALVLIAHDVLLRLH